MTGLGGHAADGAYHSPLGYGWSVTVCREGVSGALSCGGEGVSGIPMYLEAQAPLCLVLGQEGPVAHLHLCP